MTFVNTVVRTLMHPLGASSASTRTSSGLVRKLQQASDEYFGTQFIPKQNNWQRFVQKIVDAWKSLKSRIKMHFVKKEANKWLPALLGTGAAAGLAVHFREPLTELAGKLLNKSPAEMAGFFNFAQTAAIAPPARSSSSGVGSLLGKLANKFTLGTVVVGGGLFATYLARHKIASSAERITDTVSRKFADGLIKRFLETVDDEATRKKVVDFASAVGSEAAKNILADPELKDKITLLASSAGTEAITKIAENPELLKKLKNIPTEMLEDLVHDPDINFNVLTFLEGLTGPYKEKLLASYKESTTTGWAGYAKSFANLSEYNIPSQLGGMIPDLGLQGERNNLKNYAERKHIFNLGMSFKDKNIQKLAQDYIHSTTHDAILPADLERLNEIKRTKRTEGRYETAQLLYKTVKDPEDQAEFEAWMASNRANQQAELRNTLFTNIETALAKHTAWRSETQAAYQNADLELAFDKTPVDKNAAMLRLKTELTQKDWPTASKNSFEHAYTKLAKASSEEKRKLALDKLTHDLTNQGWADTTQHTLTTNYASHQEARATYEQRKTALSEIEKALDADTKTKELKNKMEEYKKAQLALEKQHDELDRLLPNQEEFLDTESGTE